MELEMLRTDSQGSIYYQDIQQVNYYVDQHNKYHYKIYLCTNGKYKPENDDDFKKEYCNNNCLFKRVNDISEL